MSNEKSRDDIFDNIKALLIFLVVFGHLIEPMLLGKIKVLYIGIYLFHMPLFVFCSGYFAKFDPKRVLTRLIYPYFMFQLLYCLFDRYVLGGEAVLQFSTPYWIMWYMLAMIVWTCTAPLLEQAKRKWQMAVIILAAFAIGLAAGFADTIGYYLSLSRIISFFPFFVLGFYLRKMGSLAAQRSFLSKWRVRGLLLLFVLAIMAWSFMVYPNFNPAWLYGSYPYAALAYSWTNRLTFYVFAMVISLLLIAVLPGKPTLFSAIGRYSIYIYLLHGFFIKLYVKFGLYSALPNQYITLCVSVLLALLLVFIFSSSPVRRVASPLIAAPFPFSGQDRKGVPK